MVVRMLGTREPGVSTQPALRKGAVRAVVSTGLGQQVVVEVEGPEAPGETVRHGGQQCDSVARAQ